MSDCSAVGSDSSASDRFKDLLSYRLAALQEQLLADFEHAFRVDAADTGHVIGAEHVVEIETPHSLRYDGISHDGPFGVGIVAHEATCGAPFCKETSRQSSKKPCAEEDLVLALPGVSTMRGAAEMPADDMPDVPLQSEPTLLGVLPGAQSLRSARLSGAHAGAGPPDQIRRSGCSQGGAGSPRPSRRSAMRVGTGSPRSSRMSVSQGPMSRLATVEELREFRDREARLFSRRNDWVSEHTVYDSAGPASPAASKALHPRACPINAYDDKEATLLINLMKSKRGRWAAFMIDVLDGAVNTRHEVDLQITYPWAALLEAKQVHRKVDARSSTCALDGFDSPARQGLLGLWRKMIILPTSKARLAWVFLGAFLVAYDMVVIPMRLAGFLGKPQETILDTLSYPMLAYWTLDVFLNFLVAFHSGGLLEADPLKIARSYMRSWFLLDMMVIVIDIVLLLVSVFSDSEAATDGGQAVRGSRMVRFMRAFRVLRIARLLRIGKLSTVLNDLLTEMRSEGVLLIVKLLEHLAAILLMNHYVACFWYGLGYYQKPGRSWLLEAEAAHIDPGVWYEGYILSLHWSLTQFTPATNNIAPNTILERAFAVNVVIFALVSFSSFVSGVTNAVNQLRQMNKDMLAESVRIRTFLTTHRVSTELGSRVLHFFNSNYRRSRQIQEKDIEFLKRFPESLLVDMHAELHYPTLMTHTIFQQFEHLDHEMLIKVCHQAVCERWYLPRQDVFLNGDDAKMAYVLSKGDLHYEAGRQAGGFSVSPLPENTWAAELALWVHWVHAGQLSAVTGCNIAVFDAMAFQNLFARHRGPVYVALKRYVSFLVGYLEGQSEIITDLPLERQITEEIVARVTSLDRVARLMKQATNTKDPSVWGERFQSVMSL